MSFEKTFSELLFLIKFRTVDQRQSLATKQKQGPKKFSNLALSKTSVREELWLFQWNPFTFKTLYLYLHFNDAFVLQF